jgi:hypothetical protein
MFVDLGTTFQVVYSLASDKFYIYASAPFKILVSSSTPKPEYKAFTLGKLLGFDRLNIASTLQVPPTFVTEPYVITPPFRKNFNDANYAILHIENFTVNTSINTILNKSFAIIPEAKNSQNVYTFSHKIRKHFNPPISRLSKIRIKFTTHTGTLYDFQNHDHIFQLTVETFKQVRRYNSYLDN